MKLICLLLSGILLLISGLTVNATQEATEMSMIISNAFLLTHGRLLEQGDVTGLLFSTGNIINVQALFRDEAGNRSQFTLPDYPLSDTKSVIEAIWIGDRLFCFSGNQQMTVREYQLSSSPLPTGATLLNATSFGDSTCKILGDNSLALKGGGLVFCWYAGYNNADFHADYGFAYRSPAGTWQVQYPVRVEGGVGGSLTMSKMALVQHPADGSIWAFAHRDSRREIIAFHFTEMAEDIRLDWINPQFIDSHDAYDREMGPDGEFPDLVVLADSTRDKILLAYQDWNVVFPSSDPFCRATYLSVAQIGGNGSKQFLQLKQRAERVRGLAMFLQNGIISLVYPAVDVTALTTGIDIAYWNGAWSVPIKIAPCRSLDKGFFFITDEIAYAANRQEIALQRNDAITDRFIEIIDIIHPVVPVPEQKAGVSLSPTNGNYLAKMGTTITLSFIVKNTGDGADTFNFQYSDTKKWGIIPPAFSLPFGVGESLTLNIGVTVPTSISNGTKDIITIKATSQFNPVVSATAHYTITARKR